MHTLQILLAILALLACSLGFFDSQFSQGPKVNWTSLGLGLMIVVWLISALAH
jgi:hypothetical protein